MYDWQWKNGDFDPLGEPWAPKWLVDRIGVDYFGHVVRVSTDPFNTGVIDDQGDVDSC